MGSASVSLERILDLEKIEVWTYRGNSWHPQSRRVFGGQVAGQALVAAGRTVPADRRVQWLFYEQESSWAGGGRALCRGLLFDRSGVLVASVMQEGLVRFRDRDQSIGNLAG
jgi:acyl-CoA thioesterase-2